MRCVNSVLLLVLAVLAPLDWAQAFGYADVVERARASAAVPYRAPPEKLSSELRDLEYDQYRDIRFKPQAALWRGDKLPFELMFFHAGRGYRDAVRINEVVADRVRPLAFDPAQFDYGRNKIDPKAVRTAGYAGFRVHFPLNRPDYKDELVVFLGASYFRALGKGQHYGLSGRGLAVDTATGKGEEFPRFTEFWIEKPAPRATMLVIHALLDSPSLTGAYRFELKPGTSTVMTVKSRLYARDAVEKLGLAPLTSMFLFGENQPGRDDYRPEVHDSDGLSLVTGNGEWIWRPLVNPQRLLVTSFSTTNPRGFGLMQRDREFSSYEDPTDMYQRRPSLWIEPLGSWGRGRVELVQIPTPDETNDNIVAYWVPDDAALRPDKPLDLSYRMHWQMEVETRPPHAWVMQSRRGRGYTKQADGQLQFVVDFDGPALKKLAAGTRPDAHISISSNAELVERSIERNPVTGWWRMTLRIKRIDADKPVELRAHLLSGKEVLSETWSYIVPAQGEVKS